MLKLLRISLGTFYKDKNKRHNDFIRSLCSVRRMSQGENLLYCKDLVWEPPPLQILSLKCIKNDAYSFPEMAARLWFLVTSIRVTKIIPDIAKLMNYLHPFMPLICGGYTSSINGAFITYSDYDIFLILKKGAVNIRKLMENLRYILATKLRVRGIKKYYGYREGFITLKVELRDRTKCDIVFFIIEKEDTTKIHDIYEVGVHITRRFDLECVKSVGFVLPATDQFVSFRLSRFPMVFHQEDIYLCGGAKNLEKNNIYYTRLLKHFRSSKYFSTTYMQHVAHRSYDDIGTKSRTLYILKAIVCRYRKYYLRLLNERKLAVRFLLQPLRKSNERNFPFEFPHDFMNEMWSLSSRKFALKMQNS